jgi:chromate reductase, NAD(P)H dehydrogenase (quinone)
VDARFAVTHGRRTTSPTAASSQPMPITIAAFSGSLRQGSYNSALLRAATGLMPDDSRIEVHSIADFPLYNGDVEAGDGIPAAVTALKDAIAVADGFLIATPEYNNSIPGVAKNAIDWLSRPPGDIPRVFRGKPAAMIGASPGGFGTILAQNAWLPVWRTLGVELWTGAKLMVSGAAKVFDEQGALTDERTRDALRGFLQGYVAYVRSIARQG